MTDRVLVAEDDRAIRESLERALRWEGYEVTAVTDGAQALVQAAHTDLLLLDLMMPGVDGLTVCKVLRGQRSALPIMMLTARTETADRVSGLDAGADDYLPKPFELAELLARMRALLRRTAVHDGGADAQQTRSNDALCIADLRLEPLSRRAWRDGREIALSRTEFDLLELMVRNQGVVLTHSAIYDRIWGYDFGPDSKNLAVYISYLRRKVDADGDALIHTVRGVGYTLRLPRP
jgi:two-component system response regulator MprA